MGWADRSRAHVGLPSSTKRLHVLKRADGSQGLPCSLPVLCADACGPAGVRLAFSRGACHSFSK